MDSKYVVIDQQGYFEANHRSRILIGQMNGVAKDIEDRLVDMDPSIAQRLRRLANELKTHHANGTYLNIHQNIQDDRQIFSV